MSRTASEVENYEGTDYVFVYGHPAYVTLTHVEVIDEDEWPEPERPALQVTATCGECGVEVNRDHGFYKCKKCGSSWGYHALDGDLADDWEDPDGDTHTWSEQ